MDFIRLIATWEARDSGERVFGPEDDPLLVGFGIERFSLACKGF